MNRFDEIRVAAGIIEASARTKIANATDLQDKFRAAFSAAQDYWMSTDDDIRLMGGVGAVMIHVGAGSPENRRITIELEQLQTLHAALSGVPVDWGSTKPLPDGYEPIGIINLWEESKK